ncbi:anaphase-promoting complex subunit 10 isoform X2 [Bufo gargarizans]|uniref:anaphase-promoting complex subunit 10 isoform X2 n=1 Tax=Bufo gargarizans TaxID=30331 RepID=UPI001CF3E8B0|nr:anaphase-promoting complex subunit 10 isoform X2 [Bufo gargarizans]
MKFFPKLSILDCFLNLTSKHLRKQLLGFGVDQLRDDNLETYWQSDGSQPHLVNIQFRRKTTVKALCIYADYKSDESYTPSKISVRVGNNFHNLQEIRRPAVDFA